MFNKILTDEKIKEIIRRVSGIENENEVKELLTEYIENDKQMKPILIEIINYIDKEQVELIKNLF